jgi:hypothetical protein
MTVATGVINEGQRDVGATVRYGGGIVTPFPSFPLNGEGEWRAFMNILNSSGVNVLREVQSASGEELSALLPSILDKAFKGEL